MQSMNNSHFETVYYIEKNGRRRKAILSNCDNCGISFPARLVKGIPQKCCSDFCRKEKKVRESKIKLVCNHCGTTFSRDKGRQAQREKVNKTDLVFCSRKCKEKAQSLESSFPELRPSHYGTSNCYREIAKRELEPCCVDCNLRAIQFLVVHHKDGDRTNNVKENLEVVCTLHHTLRHLILLNSGEWLFSTRALTPRELLPELRKLFGV